MTSTNHRFAIRTLEGRYEDAAADYYDENHDDPEADEFPEFCDWVEAWAEDERDAQIDRYAADHDLRY